MLMLLAGSNQQSGYLCWMQTCNLLCSTAVIDIAQNVAQGSGKDLIQPVLDNQLKAASPLLVPAKVHPACHVVCNEDRRTSCVDPVLSLKCCIKCSMLA